MIAEQRVDAAVTRLILDRNERVLRDLTPEQTTSLVERRLNGDPNGQKIILSILQSVFRTALDGAKLSLSGKPVIITYLLDLIEDIKAQPADGDIQPQALSEWSVYKMIIDRLMLRDQKRTPGIEPPARRACLQQLAIVLSQRDTRTACDRNFYAIIDNEFKAYLRVLDSDHRVSERAALFENLRSSATLTRLSENSQAGWAFSHNSLREYLVAEYYVSRCMAKDFQDIKAPISDSMRSFTASMDKAAIDQCINALASAWPYRAGKTSIGSYICLLWDAFERVTDGQSIDGILSILRKIGGGHILIDSIHLHDVKLCSDTISTSVINIYADNSELSRVTFQQMNLQDSNFEKSLLDCVSFTECDLTGAKFDGSLIYECDFTKCNVKEASFTSLAEKPSIVVGTTHNNQILLKGNMAIGYLKYHGANVDDIDDYFVYAQHPKFDIVFKILDKLAEQSLREIRGLTQRGVARDDPPFAREFIDYMIRREVVEVIRNEAVKTTSQGRDLIAEFMHHRLPSFVGEFLEARR